MVINIERDIKKNINVGDVVVTPTSCYMVIMSVDNKFSLLNLEDGKCIYLRKTLDELVEKTSKTFKIIKIISNSNLEMNEIQK